MLRAKSSVVTLVLAGVFLITSLAFAGQSNNPADPSYRSGRPDTTSGSPYDGGSYDRPSPVKTNTAFSFGPSRAGRPDRTSGSPRDRGSYDRPSPVRTNTAFSFGPSRAGKLDRTSGSPYDNGSYDRPSPVGTTASE
jgi:hypothetical protein